MVTQEGKAWDAIRLALEGPSDAEFLKKAHEAKQQLSASMYDLWREINLLDALVAQIAPGATWQTGFLQAAELTNKSTVDLIPSQQRFVQTRAERILEIADEMVGNGTNPVISKEIVAVLRREGERTPEANLAVSVGNVLARAEDWKRIGPGTYTYTYGVEEGEDDIY